MDADTMACRHSDVELTVLSKITPSRLDRERLENIATRARTIIEDFLGEKGLDALVTIEGSYAKDTWLKDDVDLDLFILFPENQCREIIGSGVIDELETWLRARRYTTQRRYAQHPYLRIKIEDVWIEVVPGCRVHDPSNPLTPVDRTPFHREYVLSHTSMEERNEIRLLKSFLKGIGVYGAEIAVQGFSGYLAELLIIKYKCFRTLIEKAGMEWRPQLVITLEETSRETLARLKKLYRDRPVIVVDPVDPNRNVAAALSYKSFSTFITASRLYLRKPSLAFFHVYTEPVPGEAIPGNILAEAGDRLENIIVIALEAGEPEPPDNYWGIAYRVARLAERILRNNDFTVIDRGVYVNERGDRALVVLELEARRLPRYKLHYGPPAWSRDSAERFLQKHIEARGSIGPWIDESGRLVVIRERGFLDAVAFINTVLHRWLPASARKYRVTVSTLTGLSDKLGVDEARWLRRLVRKRPHWMQ